MEKNKYLKKRISEYCANKTEKIANCALKSYKHIDSFFENIQERN